MENLIKEIRENGLKVTNQRKELLSFLTSLDSPLSLNEIHNCLRNSDFASIYRNIKLFVSLDLVREINMGDKKVRYELRKTKHTHHIICKSCGKIEKINACYLNNIKQLTEYHITDHHMEFIGLCPNCL